MTNAERQYPNVCTAVDDRFFSVRCNNCSRESVYKFDNMQAVKTFCHWSKIGTWCNRPGP